jgi:hypothetical protein
LPCRGCKGDCPDHPGPIFPGKQAAVELLGQGLACLAAGLGMRATGRGFAVEAHPVRPWLGAAAEPRRAFSTYVLCDVHVRQLPLDEGYAVLRGVRDGESRAENARKRLERARHWVWTVIDPESKRRWVTEVGPRPLEMVQRVVHHVVAL